MKKIFARLILAFWVLVLIGVLIYITKDVVLVLGIALFVTIVTLSIIWASDHL